MKKRFYLFNLLVLGGCSWFTPSKNTVEIEPPPKVTHSLQQKGRKIHRELGSLWSEDSSWNQMYSPTQTRAPGDIVTIKLDKKFMTRLEQSVKRPVPEMDPSAENKDKKKDKKDTKEGAVEAAPTAASASENPNDMRGPASQKSKTKPPETVEVTILEALPRGVYRVAANHGFKPADDSPFVYIEGILREREIAADDTAGSDALLDLKFETINRDTKVTTYDEGDER
ncbi:hypothetical protein EBT16_11525 [bacterium]|nr:hypothetical protein [bacterium]